MGNQQDIGELELAWLAGMLNGDGCFFINLREIGKGLTSEVRLTLTQTDAGLIEKAGIIMEAVTGAFPHVQEAPPHGFGKRSIMHLKVCKQTQLHALLPRLLPYLAGEKAAKARLMFRFISNRLKRTAGHENYHIKNDVESLQIAADFYTACRRELPPKVIEILRDYTRSAPQGR